MTFDARGGEEHTAIKPNDEAKNKSLLVLAETYKLLPKNSVENTARINDFQGALYIPQTFPSWTSLGILTVSDASEHFQ